MYRIVAAACALALAAGATPLRADELSFNVIQEAMTFTKADIAAAEAMLDPVTGQPIVRIKLAPVAARRFGELTGRSVSKPVQIVIGDRILSTAVVREAITGGELVISGSLTLEETRRLAAALR